MVSSHKILLTTSRNPTPKIRSFCNDLTKVIPNVVRVNRGKMSIEEVAEKTLEQGADRAFIVDRWQGGPGKIEFFYIDTSGLFPVPLTLYVAGIRLQREFTPTGLKRTRSLVLTSSDAKSQEIVDSLSKFFAILVLSEKEALSTYQVAMRVSQDAARRVQITFMLLPQKVEIGPRITLRQMVSERSK